MSTAESIVRFLAEADQLAASAHRGQTRAHGTPYVDHPRAVLRLARTLDDALGLGLSDSSLVAALLHDVVEDSEVSLVEVETQFGAATAAAVDALSKPPLTSGQSKKERDEQYWKALAGASDDVRIIKICDRLHNLSELHLRQDAAKARRYLDETRLHVLPLATLKAPGTSRGIRAAIEDAIAAAQRACVLAEAVSPAPRGLYPLLNIGPGSRTSDTRAFVRAVCAAGVALVQVRCKGISDRLAIAHARAAVEIASPFQVSVVVNDRTDIAQLAGARAVHLGQQDLLPADAARLAEGPLAYGRSTHTADQCDEALGPERVDGDSLLYVAIGPVHLSATKRGHASVVGLAAFSARAKTCGEISACAIGGLTTSEAIADVVRAGATLVAVVSALDPRVTSDSGHPRVHADRAKSDSQPALSGPAESGSNPALTADDEHEIRLRTRLFQIAATAAAESIE